ncbi:MAG: hypothetical protein ACNA71_05720 [Kiritimatiellia bacterium]
MKTRYYVMLVLAIASTNTLARQQSNEQPDRTPRARQRQEIRNNQRENDTRGRRQQGMQWLHQLEKSDPAEFQKVQHMRQEDPQAFAQWMRTRMRERRRQAVLERHPAFAAFLATLPESERQALEADLFPARQRSEQTPESAPDIVRQRGTAHGPQQADVNDRTRHFEQEIERAEKRIQHLRELLEKRRELLETMPQD